MLLRKNINGALGLIRFPLSFLASYNLRKCVVIGFVIHLLAVGGSHRKLSIRRGWEAAASMLTHCGVSVCALYLVRVAA